MVRRFFNPRSDQARFWNAYAETMPRDRLDALQLRRIKAMLRYAYDRVPMYRKLYDAHGVHPDRIRTMDDFIAKIPIIDKKDLLAAQAVSPPWGEALAVPEDYLIYRFQTSGTTGVPLHIPITYYSSVMYGEQWVYGFWHAGIRPPDSFYFAFNWGTFIGFWSTYWGVRRLGATVYSGGGQDTKGRITQILQYRPTVVLGTPTYVLYMAEVAKEMGVDLAATSVRYIYTAGEPGPSIPATRRAIEEAWGAKAYELYGIGEVGAICPGCSSQEGVHLAEDQAHCLVLDETNQPVREGGIGENIVTSFIQYAQPIIKYRTHDLVEWHFKGGVLGRTDHMIVIKGTNVYPTAVEAMLGRVRGLTENYEIHVDHVDRDDVVTVKVEAARELPEPRYDEVGLEAEQLFRANIGVRIGCEVLKPGALPRYELKAKRFFDHRPPERKWQIQR
ncbi:MAG: AMP-binding protein [Deltaproteobacteria bacterium]|nr:AMP-binding protein [Deltaproteobacteria bacterium]